MYREVNLLLPVLEPGTNATGRARDDAHLAALWCRIHPLVSPRRREWVLHPYTRPNLTTDLARPLSTSTARSKDISFGELSDPSKQIISKIEEIAKKRDLTMSQVALAWSISKPFISAPIIGTTKLEQLDELIKGCEVELSAEEIKSIDELYQASKIFGHG